VSAISMRPLVGGFSDEMNVSVNAFFTGAPSGEAGDTQGAQIAQPPWPVPTRGTIHLCVMRALLRVKAVQESPLKF
jgi:hypothetical protein